MKKIVVAVIGLLMLFTTACSGDGYTDPSMTTLRYEKGASQGGKFVECIEPGRKIVTNDTLYPYPNTQREAVWDSANYEKGNKSADYPDLELVDKNGVTVFTKMKVSFFLNTDCKPVKVGDKTYDGGTLQAFHELIGRTRGAYFNEDGGYNDGWLWAMDNYVSSSVTDYMVKAARSTERDAESMWLDSAQSVTMQEELAKQMPALVNAGMETDLQFYDKFTVKIYSVTPDSEFLGMYKERQSAQVKSETAELNRQARVAEARANAEVAEAEAGIKQEEIKGYGGFDNWNKAKAVENGLNPYQPTYIVGGSAR